MNYIIEVHRPSDSQVEPKEFSSMLEDWIKRPKCPEFDVFLSITECKKSYEPIEIISDNKHTVGRVKKVKYIAVDNDYKMDTYYISLDVPDEYKYLMHEGRGAFVPFFVYDHNDMKNILALLDYIQKGGQ